MATPVCLRQAPEVTLESFLALILHIQSSSNCSHFNVWNISGLCPPLSTSTVWFKPPSSLGTLQQLLPALSTSLALQQFNQPESHRPSENAIRSPGALYLSSIILTTVYSTWYLPNINFLPVPTLILFLMRLRFSTCSDLDVLYISPTPFFVQGFYQPCVLKQWGEVACCISQS